MTGIKWGKIYCERDGTVMLKITEKKVGKGTVLRCNKTTEMLLASWKRHLLFKSKTSKRLGTANKKLTPQMRKILQNMTDKELLKDSSLEGNIFSFGSRSGWKANVDKLC